MKGDEIFEAEHLPAYAKTYILPKQMVRRMSYKEDEGIRKSSVESGGPLSRKTSINDATNNSSERKKSVVNADFQFSMLKASLDYDTEIFGANTSQRVIDNNPLSRNYSTVSSIFEEEEPTQSKKKKGRRESLQSCNAPGGMLEYSKYVQEGGFVPESIRNSEVGLDLEIYNVKASDIQERMTNFQEANFYEKVKSKLGIKRFEN